MPPRKSTRSSARGQQKPKPPVADVQEEEEEEEEEVKDKGTEEGDEHDDEDSKNTRRSSRKSSSAVKSAERVTRSRTRASRNETPERNPPIDYDEGSDAEVDTPKRSKRRAKSGSRRPSPRKRGGKKTRRRASTSSKRKGRSGKRRSSKKDSDDEEESEEEELDLGESEEDEEEEEEEEEDDYDGGVTKSKSKRALPPATPGSRRSSRHVVSRATSSPSSNKSSPSVVLERIESTPPKSRSTRSRGGAQKKDVEATSNVSARQSRAGRSANRRSGAKVAAVAVEEDEEEEEEEEEEKDEEEQETAEKDVEKKGGEKSGNKRNAKSKDVKVEDIPNDEKKKGSANDEADEAMEIDESVDTAGKKNKRKVNDDEVQELPPSKKMKTEEDVPKESVDSKVEGDNSTKCSEPVEGNVESVTQKEELSPIVLDGDEDKKSPVMNGADESTVESIGKENVSEEPKMTPNNQPAVGQANGDGENLTEVISASLGKKVSRRCVSCPGGSVTSPGFSIVSYNLAVEDWTAKHQNLLEEISFLAPSILCFQNVDEAYFKSLLDSALKSRGYMGLYKAGKTASEGLATFYLLSSFEILRHREFDVHDLLTKDLDDANLSEEAKSAAKTLLQCSAPVLISKLKSVSGTKCITVGNVHMPSEENDAIVALQVDALLREVLNIGDGADNPHVLCGVICLADGSVTQQLLKDGQIQDERLEELKKTAMIPVPNGENTSLVSLLGKSFNHSSVSLKNSYESLLGHELKVSEGNNAKLSKDCVWFSGGSLQLRSVLDVTATSTEVSPQPNVHVSLKVDLNFIN